MKTKLSEQIVTLDINDVAMLFRCSREQIRRLIRLGRFPVGHQLYPRGKRIWRLDELTPLLDQRAQAVGAGASQGRV